MGSSVWYFPYSNYRGVTQKPLTIVARASILDFGWDSGYASELDQEIYSKLSINFYTQSEYYRNFHDGDPYHAPSAKKVLLKMFTKLTGKHPCWSLFLTQQPATLLKKTATQTFSRKFCEICQNTFFTERLWTTAVSKKCRISLDRCSIKKVFQAISQNLQKNSSVGLSF